MLGIGLRLTAVFGLALVVGACSSGHGNTTAPSTTRPANPTTSTSVAPGSSSSTTKPIHARPTDPLPGAVLVAAHDREIDTLDASGHKLATLVTVFAGRTVTNLQLMADHRTIWYSTSQGHPRTCDEVVKLDLRTNTRTLMAYAIDFTVSADGSRLLLVWPKTPADLTAQCTEKPALTFTTRDALLVRDLRTGAQSGITTTDYPTAGSGGPSGHVWMSPSGNELIDSVCTQDPCGTRLWNVPQPLGAALPRSTTAGPACGCATLVSGPGAVYGIDEGSFRNRRTTLRRYDPAQLTGPGTVVVTPAGITMGSVAPTATTVYVAGYRTGSPTASVYRLAGDTLLPLSSSYGQLAAIPAFVAAV